jgi:hypothetical protein
MGTQERFVEKGLDGHGGHDSRKRIAMQDLQDQSRISRLVFNCMPLPKTG